MTARACPALTDSYLPAALGITGYAKNLADGTVQVLACGEPEAMDRLAEWLQQGPPMAQVTKVEWSVMESECLNVHWFPDLTDAKDK